MNKEFFGHNAVFIMDPMDDSNRPVPGIHANVIRRWEAFPKILNNLFVKAFCKESIMHPEKRVNESEWMSSLVALRSRLKDKG